MCSIVLYAQFNEHIFNGQGGGLPWCRREDLTALGSSPEAGLEGTICGIDLGSRTLATVAVDRDAIALVHGPQPRKRLLGRIKRIQRHISLGGLKRSTKHLGW